jgi:hypothetical protein
MSEITAKPAVTSMQQHKPSPSLSKQTEIVKLLTRLSLSRRAAVNPETLAQDAADLSTYELDDIATGIEIVRRRGRSEGEAAYPEIHVIEEAIRGVKRGSNERRAIEEENKRIAHFKANPELYLSKEEFAEFGETIKNIANRKAMA